MADIEGEHQIYEHGILGHDFVSMFPEAIRLRELIDSLGVAAVKEQITIEQSEAA